MKKTSAEKKRFPLNIIDILVLVLLIVVAVILVRKVTAVNTQKAKDSNPASAAAVYRDPAELDREQYNVFFEAVAAELDPAFAETVKASVEQEANRINNSFALQDAYITQVELEPYIAEDGTQQPGRVNLRFHIVANVNYGDYYTDVDGNFNPYLGSQDLRIGKDYVLKTMQVELATTIVALEVRNG